MRNNIPIIIPEMDINLRLGRFLVIIHTLAFTQRGKLVLNIDKLIIFDFLVKYPFILKSVLKSKYNNSSFKLQDEEMGSITTLYPSNSALLDINSAKSLMRLLISYNLVSIKVHNSEVFYILTDEGKHLINELNTDYSNRMKELCGEMLVLRSISTNEIRQIIKPLIRGV